MPTDLNSAEMIPGTVSSSIVHMLVVCPAPLSSHATQNHSHRSAGLTFMKGPNPTHLVAKFLLDNNYLETLELFALEANIKLDELNSHEDDGEQVTLELLLEDRRITELSLALQQSKLEQVMIKNWQNPSPSTSELLPLKTQTNVLFVAVFNVVGKWMIAVTTADRALRLYDFKTYELLQQYTTLHSSPILQCCQLLDRYLLTAGMDGNIVLSDLVKQVEILKLPKPHLKYVHRIVVHADRWIASCGYDKRVHVYSVSEADDSECTPVITHVGCLDFSTLPEAIVFIPMSRVGEPHLLVTTRDSCFLEYYTLPDLILHSRHNMNENNDLWVSYTAVDIAVQPVPPHHVGIATSSTPFGRWIAFEQDNDRIVINAWTGAPQSDLGVPSRFAWRADGSGFYVNSDDGIIRGIETKTGKVVAKLGEYGTGHESAVRSIWAGIVDGEEIVVSGSFDRTVRIWR